MSANDVWQDFEGLRHNVKLNTVDRLKQILGGFNDECGTHFSKSGKKQEIIDRIVHTIDSWRQANSVDKWVKAKAILYQVRNSGTYTPSRAPTALHSASSMASNSYTSAASIGKLSSTYSPASGGLSANSFNNPYAARKLLPPLDSSGPSAAYRAPGSSKPELRFKDSPFFQIHETVSGIIECPESQSAADRKSSYVNFTLTPDQINKLQASGSKYHLRLFCTSSTFYSPNSTFRSLPLQAPIEFPSTCEVRINSKPINANLKGLKKKPGTAPPPKLDYNINYDRRSNQIEMVYVNSQQPTQPKKFYIVVKMVESTSVTSLVDDLRRHHFESFDKIKKQMQTSSLEDDDIIPGPQKVSLKCPLTLARIVTPCRSSKCVHIQCFDATSWFSVNEQTTTWLCPVCEKTLDVNDLIIDGYSESILKYCPDSVDDVMVEADGEWHTSDDKYGSPNWQTKHPPKLSNTPSRKSAPTPKLPTINGASSSTGSNSVSKNIEITVLDSDDDEDEGRVKRELSPSFGNISSASGSYAPPTVSRIPSADIIDLTIDSDDDEPPPPRNPGKRKASDAVSPTESIWKKMRTTNSSPSSSPDDLSSSRFVNTRPTASAPNPSMHLPPLILLQPLLHFHPFILHSQVGLL
ncbi:PINIT domain-containing protein [Rhodocollybia butyracea]|uniref:PINIT domain-containing protein n=1 Tax=Rhodocollybia butyracea TaxID=206335 RepID=A0A9P5UEH7_9AGAR|nr:PINIT domain-containing protein [Rhodocollybia butyracea]